MCRSRQYKLCRRAGRIEIELKADSGGCGGVQYVTDSPDFVPIIHMEQVTEMIRTLIESGKMADKVEVFLKQLPLIKLHVRTCTALPPRISCRIS